MRLLLDAHILLWALAEPERLGDRTRQALEEPGNHVLFSAASIWEIAIKASLGRADFKVDAGAIYEAALATGFIEAPVLSQAAIAVALLPHLHRDPFDRLLIAQAVTIPARLLTADPLLPPYSDIIDLVS